MGKTGSTKKAKISTKDRNSRKSSKLKKFLFSFILTAVAFSLIFVESYRIPSRSMEDTLFYGDFILFETLHHF